MINPLHSGNSADWCTFVKERMELFLDGELYGSENLAFVTHLKECEDCAAHWAADEDISRRLMVTFGEKESREPVPATGPGPRPIVFDDAPRQKSSVLRRVAMIASLSAASLLLGWFVGRTSPSDAELLSTKTAPIVAVVAARTGASVRPIGVDSVRSLDRGDRVDSGTEITAPGDSELVLAVEDRGRISVGPDSVLRIREPHPGDDCAVEVISGRVDLDFTGGGFSVKALGWSIAAYDAAATIFVHEIAANGAPERAVVMERGRATLEGPNGTVSLGAGQKIDLLTGRVMDRRSGEIDAVELSATQRLVTELESRLTAKDLEIENLENTVARLEEEIKRARAEVIAGSVSEEMPESIIREYLDTVELANHVEIDPPNGFARSAMIRLSAFGPEVVGVLDGFLVRETKTTNRIALLGLVAGVGGAEATEVLKRASFDAVADVRYAAMSLLTKIEDLGLAEHFMTVHRNEQRGALKSYAAYGAARLGNETGLNALFATFYDEKGYCERMHSLTLILKLDRDPAVRAFMHRVLRDWRPGDGATALRIIVRKIGEMNDIEAMPLLRDLTERQGLPSEVKRVVDDVIEKLPNE